MRKRAPKQDPAFAAIARHQTATKTEARTKASLDRLRARLDGMKSQAGLPARSRLTCDFPLMPIGDPPLTLIDGRAAIRKHVEHFLDVAAKYLGPKAARNVRGLGAEAVKELEREWDRFHAAHMAKQAACGLTTKERASVAAEEAVHRSLMALTKVRPTTDAGRKALADYAASVDDLHRMPPWAMRHVLANVVDSRTEPRPPTRT